MSSLEILKDLKFLTKSLMLREGVQNYELQIKGFSEMGENYLGEVVFFSIINKDDNKTHNLVMKTAKRCDKLRKSIPVRLAYKRECFMYRNVFPAYRKYLKSKGDLFKLDYIPKVFLFFEEDGRECLILEDLRDLGYNVMDRLKPMSIHHVLLVLKTLGKHHALSIAMKNDRPKIFEENAKHLNSVWDQFALAMDNVAIFHPPIQRVCQLLRNKGRNDVADKIEETILRNVTSILQFETPVKDRLVICHGDCWSNNIMFKCEEDKKDSKPTALNFVDYQLSMLDSPAKDLSYFIYIGCEKLLLNKFDHLLQTYYDSFSTTLELLGCKPEQCYTYDCLLDHFKKYGATGLILSTLILKLQMLRTEEALELADVLGNDSEAPEVNTLEMEDEEIFYNRLLDSFVHFGDRFL